MKKTAKRLLSLVMALALVFSVMSVAASAATSTTTKHYNKYVCLGDSVGSGFGQEDYNQYGKMVSSKTSMKRIRNSYPDLVAAWTGADLTNLCMPGYTSAALRYELDDSYEMTEWELYEMSNFTFGFYDAAFLKKNRKTFRNAIKNADLITLDIGLNDTWYPSIALVYYIAEQGSIGPFDPRETLEKELENYGTWGTVVRNAMYFIASWAENPTEWAHFVSMFVEMMSNYMLAYAKNYEAIVKAIYALNPDVTVVSVGIVNSFKYMSFVPGVNGTLQLEFMDEPVKVTLPFIGDFILPNEVTLAPSLAMVASGMYDLLYTPSRKYYSQVYDNYYYVDVSQAELIGQSWTIPLYENSTLDDSGFNPHPTKAGHKYIAEQIVSVLPEGKRKVETLIKGKNGWGVYFNNGTEGQTLSTSYTGFAKTSGKYYYVKNGKLANSYTGIVGWNNKKYYVKNGRVRTDYSGTVKTSKKIYTIKNGVVTKEVSR